jgi:hypothetical protein
MTWRGADGLPPTARQIAGPAVPGTVNRGAASEGPCMAGEI